MTSHAVTWRRFLGFLKPYVKYEVLLLALLLLGNAAALASPYFLKVLIDQVFPHRDASLLITLAGSIFGVYVLRILVNLASDYLYNWISNQMLSTLSVRLFNHILLLPLSFFRESSVGDLVHRMNNEVGNVRHVLTGAAINFINNLISIIGLIVIMCVLEARLFMTICLIYPLLFVSIRIFDPKIKRVVEKIRLKESGLLGYFSERFANIKYIKIFHSYDLEARVNKEKIRELVRHNLRGGALMSGSRGVSTFLLSMIPLLTLGFGGWQVLKGAITVGTLIAFLQYANKLHDPFQNVVGLYIELVNASVSLSRIFEVLDRPVPPSDEPMQPIQGRLDRIELDNISFTYGDRPVLRNINFTFQLGRHYAIVGPSGSGKTTLIDLLCKFYRPEKGRILVNGRDLEEIGMKDWMQRVSVSSQGYFLFNGTIFENIRYGRPDADEEDIFQASKMVRLFNDHRDYLPGLMHAIGDGGCRISGGQKQKISFGRVMLRNPELLVVDEATSEIDSQSEEAIYESLFTKPDIKTIILVSHRLSTLKHVQEIICIEKGCIVEHGSMTELIRRKGAFYKLFENQLQFG